MLLIANKAPGSGYGSGRASSSLVKDLLAKPNETSWPHSCPLGTAAEEHFYAGNGQKAKATLQQKAAVAAAATAAAEMQQIF